MGEGTPSSAGDYTPYHFGAVPRKASFGLAQSPAHQPLRGRGMSIPENAVHTPSQAEDVGMSILQGFGRWDSSESTSPPPTEKSERAAGWTKVKGSGRHPGSSASTPERDLSALSPKADAARAEDARLGTPPHAPFRTWETKGDRKGKGKGKDKGAKGKGKGAKPSEKIFKTTARFIVPLVIAEDDKFKAAKYLIGRGGSNMKHIAEETGAKLRVRGRGSGHLEGPCMQEASDPLMLCISAPTQDGFDAARDRVEQIFEKMFDTYRAHCKRTGREEPELVLEVVD